MYPQSTMGNSVEYVNKTKSGPQIQNHMWILMNFTSLDLHLAPGNLRQKKFVYEQQRENRKWKPHGYLKKRCNIIAKFSCYQQIQWKDQNKQQKQSKYLKKEEKKDQIIFLKQLVTSLKQELMGHLLGIIFRCRSTHISVWSSRTVCEWVTQNKQLGHS